MVRYPVGQSITATRPSVDGLNTGFDITMAEKSDVYFYHLERKSLEDVLPGLLERALARKWRAVVQTTSKERVAALDLSLWTYDNESFLAHGSSSDGFADQQPIYLTTGAETPNAAEVRFLVDGAETVDFSTHVRVVHLFDGNDPDATEHARGQWRVAKQAGCEVQYWRQSPDGRWENKA